VHNAVITLVSLVWKYEDSDLMDASASLMIASSATKNHSLSFVYIPLHFARLLVRSYLSLSYRTEIDRPMPGNAAK